MFRDVSVLTGKFQGSSELFFLDGRVKFDYVEFYEALAGFAIDTLKPSGYLKRIFPLYQIGLAPDIAEYIVEQMLTDFPDVGFSGVDQPTFYAVGKTLLMVFDGKEGWSR